MNKELIHLVDNTLIPHSAFIQVTKQIEQCFEFAEGASESITLPIIGESRTGKSRAIETFTRLYPVTRTADKVHQPILQVTMPSDPSKNSLVKEMLIEMGDPMPEKGDQIEKTRRLHVLIKSCGTRMVIIDEFQHLIDKASNKLAYNAADWIKNFLNKSKVALVFAGLPYCSQVLTLNEQFLGRSLTPIHLPRFDWLSQEHRRQFIGILGGFDSALRKFIDFPALNHEEMAFRLYCATGGLIGYLTKFLRQLTWDCDSNNKYSLNLSDFDNAYEKSLNHKLIGTEFIHPFAEDFIPQPTEDILKQVAQIGIRQPEPVAPRRRRNKGLVS